MDYTIRTPPPPPITERWLPSLPPMTPSKPLPTFALPSVTRTLTCPLLISVTHRSSPLTNSRKSSVRAPRPTLLLKRLRRHLWGCPFPVRYLYLQSFCNLSIYLHKLWGCRLLPPPPPAPADRVPIPSLAAPTPPGTSLINPDPNDPVLARPYWSPRLPAPVKFLAGRCLSPRSSRSRLDLIVDHLASAVVDDTYG